MLTNKSSHVYTAVTATEHSEVIAVLHSCFDDVTGNSSIEAVAVILQRNAV